LGLVIQGLNYNGDKNMAEKRERVTLSVTLKGQGHEVRCKVSVMKVTSLDFSDVAYPDFSIIDNHDTTDLPDGRYQVFYEDISIPPGWVVRRNGFFVSS
jgi:hypothetical protein